MRYAIFSDIHNHTSALTAVLSHARVQGVDGYFCLGDVGIDACVNLVRSHGAPTVFGNWEVSNWRILSEGNQRWALSLPPMRKQRGFWLTHAAPLWPKNLATLAELNKNRYRVASMSRLFPYLHHESEALWESLAVLTEVNVPVMFHGHTHRQMVWRFNGDNQLQLVAHGSITLQPGDTLLVGVGSVGHPLDGPHPAYVIFDDKADTIELVRVE